MRASRSVTVFAVLVGALLTMPSALCAQGDGLPSSPRPRKINVVIIGVSTWELPEYKNSVLRDHILDACDGIVQFFRNRFTEDELDIYPATQPCTAHTTTYAAIRRLLYSQLPNFGAGTLTFVFMLSHGEVVRYGNPFLESDLRFITSDTSSDDRDGTSLSLGIEFINWLQKLPTGSTVLAFIDTCNAGAVNSLKLQVEQSLQRYAGLRFGIVVGSLSTVTAYRASFTRALLALWQQERCPSDVKGWLYDRIVELTRPQELAPFEGRPDVVVDYGGGWCLNELRAGGKVLLLYQGQVKNVRWTITPTDPAAGSQARIVDTTDEPFRLVLMAPGRYQVSALTLQDVSANRAPRPIASVDLVNRSTTPVYFTEPTRTVDLVAAYEALLNSAEYRGDSTSVELAVIRNGLSLARTAAGLTAPARAANESDAGGPVAPPPPQSPRNPTDPVSQSLIASEHLQNGNFNAAANLLTTVATALRNTPAGPGAAMAALATASAAGNTVLADTIRKRFNLPPNDIVSALDRVKRNPTSEIVDELRTRAIMSLTAEHQELLGAVPLR